MNRERSGACRQERQAVLPARLHGLRGELEALLRACPANVPETGDIVLKKNNYSKGMQ